MADLVKLRAGSSPFATLGGLLSYMPAAPSTDPIGKDVCVPVAPMLRDAGRRFVPDSPSRAAILRRAIDALGPDADTMALITAIVALEDQEPPPPSSLSIEDRLVETLPEDVLLGIIEWFARSAPEGLLTIVNEAPEMGGLRRLVHLARSSGVQAVHIRRTTVSRTGLTELLRMEPDVMSVDLPMPSEEPRWTAACRELEEVVAAAREGPASGRAPTWIVPRLTKCDASYDVLEGFFDRWLLAGGAACIDATTAAAAERIQPLPLPRSAQERLARTVMYVRWDAGIHACDVFTRGGTELPTASLRSDSIEEAWRARVAERRRRAGGSK